MANEGDLNNFLEALNDLRQKLQLRDELKSKITDTDRYILSSLARLRAVSKLQFESEEDHMLDAFLHTTRHLLDESFAKRNSNEDE